MKIKWTQNWGLKIGSLLFAVILWLLITNIEDPIISKNFYNVPVRLVNTDVLSKEGKVYEVLEGTDVIDRVTIRASRSLFNQIANSNIVATADLNDLSSLDTVRIDLNVNNAQIAGITGSSDLVRLNIEEEVTKSFQIEPTTSGELADGFILGDISIEQNRVRLTGPASLIDSVVYVEADTSVSQAGGDINTEADVVLFDKDRNQINSNRIEQNIKVIRVKISVLETRTVPIQYSLTGAPAEGFRATGVVESSRESVSLAGKSSVIRNISRIELPESLLDISNATENYEKDVDIASFLPEGIRLEDSSNNMIHYTVYIEQEVSETVTLREDRVRIVNMPDGFTGSFSGMDEEVSIGLVGLRGELDRVLAADISGEIDVAQLMEDRELDQITEGFYTVEVNLNLGEQITVIDPVEVTLHVTTAEE